MIWGWKKKAQDLEKDHAEALRRIISKSEELLKVSHELALKTKILSKAEANYKKLHEAYQLWVDECKKKGQEAEALAKDVEYWKAASDKAGAEIKDLCAKIDEYEHMPVMAKTYGSVQEALDLVYLSPQDKLSQMEAYMESYREICADELLASQRNLTKQLEEVEDALAAVGYRNEQDEALIDLLSKELSAEVWYRCSEILDLLRGKKRSNEKLNELFPGVADKSCSSIGSTLGKALMRISRDKESPLSFRHGRTSMYRLEKGGASE